MWRRHVCYVCKRSVCGGDEPQPVAHLSHKLQCARQSLKIMVSYGNKYPRHKTRTLVVEQSGQCARALMASETNLPAVFTVSLLPILLRLFLRSGRRQVLPLRPNHLPAKVRIWKVWLQVHKLQNIRN